MVSQTLTSRRIPHVACVVAGRIACLAMGAMVHVTAPRNMLLRARPAALCFAAAFFLRRTVAAAAAFGPELAGHQRSDANPGQHTSGLGQAAASAAA